MRRRQSCRLAREAGARAHAPLCCPSVFSARSFPGPPSRPRIGCMLLAPPVSCRVAARGSRRACKAAKHAAARCRRHVGAPFLCVAGPGHAWLDFAASRWPRHRAPAAPGRCPSGSGCARLLAHLRLGWCAPPAASSLRCAGHRWGAAAREQRGRRPCPSRRRLAAARAGAVAAAACSTFRPPCMPCHPHPLARCGPQLRCELQGGTQRSEAPAAPRPPVAGWRARARGGHCRGRRRCRAGSRLLRSGLRRPGKLPPSPRRQSPPLPAPARAVPAAGCPMRLLPACLPAVQVRVLEKMPEAGKKILISGG